MSPLRPSRIASQTPQKYTFVHFYQTPGHTVLLVAVGEGVGQFPDISDISDMCGSLVSPTILTSTMASRVAWQEVLTEMLITNNFLPAGFPSRHTHFSYFAEFEVFIIISKFHVISFAKLGPGGAAGTSSH